MNRITATFVKHGQQRYETAGDYFNTAPGEWQFVITKLSKDCRMECMLYVHELLEMLLTQCRGISEHSITAWDKKCLKTHPDAEPGDLPGCPYRREHRFAEKVERMLAKEMGVRWSDYTKALDALWQPQPRKPARPARNR